MDDLLRTTAGRKRTRAAAQLGFGPAEPPPGDPLRPAPPSPDPPSPDPPSPPPRPGRVPPGPRDSWWQQPADFIGQLMRRSHRY